MWWLEDSLSICTQFSLRQHLLLPTAASAGYLGHQCPDILLSLSPIHPEECRDHRRWTFVSTHVHPASLRLRGLNAGLSACLKTRSPLSHLRSNFPLLFRDSSSKIQVQDCLGFPPQQPCQEEAVPSALLSLRGRDRCRLRSIKLPAFPPCLVRAQPRSHCRRMPWFGPSFVLVFSSG